MVSHSKKISGKEKTSKKKISKNAALEYEMIPCTVQVYKMTLEDIAPFLKMSVCPPVPVSSPKIQKSKKTTKTKKPKEKKRTEKVVISLSKLCIVKPTPRTRKSSRLEKTSSEEEEKKRAFLANLGLVDHETAKARITELNCPQLQASRWSAIRALQPLIFKKNQALTKKLLRIRKTKMTKSMKATTSPPKRGRPAKKNKEKGKKKNNQSFSSPPIPTMDIPQNMNQNIVAPDSSSSPPKLVPYYQIDENRQMNPICSNMENSFVPALLASVHQEVALKKNITKETPQTLSITPFICDDSSRGNTNNLSLIKPWVTGEVSRGLPLTTFEKLEILQVFLNDINDTSPPPLIECITID